MLFVLTLTPLQVNPVKRITIQQIREHEWFKQDVPEYLFPPLGETNHAQIDSSALAEVCQKLSVPPQEVVMAIRSGDHHNELSIAYHLVLDNRIFQSHASFPEAIHLATSPPNPASPPGTSSSGPKTVLLPWQLLNPRTWWMGTGWQR